MPHGALTAAKTELDDAGFAQVRQAEQSGIRVALHQRLHQVQQLRLAHTEYPQCAFDQGVTGRS